MLGKKTVKNKGRIPLFQSAVFRCFNQFVSDFLAVSIIFFFADWLLQSAVFFR